MMLLEKGGERGGIDGGGVGGEREKKNKIVEDKIKESEALARRAKLLSLQKRRYERRRRGQGKGGKGERSGEDTMEDGGREGSEKSTGRRVKERK